MDDYEAQMLVWLKQHFETDEERHDKVTVDEVKTIFNEKFPGKTNNLFGKMVRKAFPGIERTRDSVAYYYRPLRWKPIGVRSGKESLSKLTQTSYVETPQTKEILQKQLAEKQGANETLQKDNQLLKTTVDELQSKNQKWKEYYAKRHDSEVVTSKRPGAKNAEKRTSKRAKIQDVNIINPDELIGENNDFVGEGTFGKCYLKTFTRTGTLVAIKNMKYEHYEACKREAKIMQSLTSDRFPYIFGIVEQPLSIVMQFIGDQEMKRSATLYQVVSDKGNEIGKAMMKRDWFQVCKDMTVGIDHLHSLSFLHNDLKNNNVLIDRKGAYIIDLGKACEASNSPAKKYVTFYNHLAPEILQGRCCSLESDIYSLGITFNFIRTFCDLNEIRSVEKDCTLNNQVMRPRSTQVLEKINVIHSTM